MLRFLSAVIALSLVGHVNAQTLEPLKGPEKSMYDALKRGEGDIAAKEAKAVITKQAKYLVARLSDPNHIDNQSNNMQAAIEALPLQLAPPKKEVSAAQLKFNEMMTQAMVAELKSMFKHSKLIVRINAARLLSIVAMMGCDAVAAPALEILNDAKETDGVKVYALQTLKNIFAYIADPAFPEKSAFTKQNAAVERQAIQFLCDYILRKPDLTGMSPEQINAIHFCRREAVQALGFVRTHRLRFNGQVIAMPGWVLLKVANADGIEPRPEILERSQAVYAFTQLFPVTRANVDRDINMEYAADRLAAPMLEIITIKANPPLGVATQIASVPWLVTAHFWQYGLDQLQTNVNLSQLDGAAAVKALYDQAKGDLLDPLKNPNGVPNTAGFQGWFSGKRTTATELYKGDANSAVKPCIQ